MSAEVQAYNESPGVRLNVSEGPRDVVGRAQVLLDLRDEEHRQQFGHLPGDRVCTLPGRGAYEQHLRSQLAEQRCLIPPGVSTAQAQDIIRGVYPGVFIPDPSADPETNKARQQFAAGMAAVQVSRG